MTSLIQGLIATRSVNLAMMCDEEVETEHKVLGTSKYRRFQRFFKDFDMPLKDVYALIKHKIPRPEGGYILSMDRTNWQFGKKHINILTIGINVGKVSVPLVWKALPQSTKKGNSNSKQRIALVREMLEVLPANEIHSLLMEREFHGTEWLEWLHEQGIAYVLRIKHNTIVGEKLANEHGAARGRRPKTPQNIWGLKLYFACKKIKKGRDEDLYVVSNRFEPQEALSLYRKRWAIEQLFSHLKKRGFHLEDTHMSHGKKIERLMGMVSISFLFSYAWGMHLRTIEKQTAFVRRKSHYRYGLGSLNRMLKNPRNHQELIQLFMKWLDEDHIVSIPS